MRFGVCTGPENLELVKRIGFDYIEFTVTLVESLSDADFADLLSRVNSSAIKVECFNVLFPGTIKLVGPEADRAKIAAYLEKAFARVKALGGSVVVFGSGKSRALPQDMAYKDAFCELVKVTRLIGDIAGKFGITIGIEALNREESNCVNSMIEGAMLAGAADHPNVELHSDLYHILKEKEPMENVLRAKSIIHTHIALLEGRAIPTMADNDIKAFFGVLKQIGYNGTMSLEGNAKDLETDLAKALNVLKQELT